MIDRDRAARRLETGNAASWGVKLVVGSGDHLTLRCDPRRVAELRDAGPGVAFSLLASIAMEVALAGAGFEPGPGEAQTFNVSYSDDGLRRPLRILCRPGHLGTERASAEVWFQDYDTRAQLGDAIVTWSPRRKR